NVGSQCEDTRRRRAFSRRIHCCIQLHAIAHRDLHTPLEVDAWLRSECQWHGAQKNQQNARCEIHGRSSTKENLRGESSAAVRPSSTTSAGTFSRRARAAAVRDIAGAVWIP